MNKWPSFCVIAFLTIASHGREPFKAREGSLPFLAKTDGRISYFWPGNEQPLNRIARYGIIINLVDSTSSVNDTATIGYTVQQSPAILILKRRVPDVLVEIPLRPIDIDYKGEQTLSLHEECLMAGWHFFYKGDKIYPINKFLLQRNVRVQFLDIVKKNVWCETLMLKFQKALVNIGYKGFFDKSLSVCIRDGMYGAPLICHGKVVGMMMAPDAQWSNCTGYSNLIHLFNSEHNQKFMACVSSMFEPEYDLPWDDLKTSLVVDKNEKEYDYIPAMYDRILGDSSTSSEGV